MKQVKLIIHVGGDAVYYKTLPPCGEDRVRSVIIMTLEMARKEGIFFVDGNIIIPYKFEEINYTVEDV